MRERTYSRDEVREIDRRAIEEYALPGIVLMENAGRGCVELLLDAGARGPVVICCGRGNNGGDGYVMARHLENAGLDVQVLLFSSTDNITGDAGVNLRVLQSAGTHIRAYPELPADDELDDRLGDAEWIVDALLGTGTRGEIREPYATVIEAVNRSAARKFAVDLPSGLDCDRGEPLGPCIRAEITGTLVGRKRGFENPSAAPYTGNVRVVDIGVPRKLLTSSAGKQK